MLSFTYGTACKQTVGSSGKHSLEQICPPAHGFVKEQAGTRGFGGSITITGCSAPGHPNIAGGRGVGALVGDGMGGFPYGGVSVMKRRSMKLSINGNSDMNRTCSLLMREQPYVTDSLKFYILFT